MSGADNWAEGTVIDGPGGQSAVRRAGKWVLQGTTAAQATLPKPDQDALASLTADMQQKQTLAQRAQQFMKLQGEGAKGIATGPGYADMNIPIISKLIPNLVRTYQDVAHPDVAAKLQTMDSISNQTFPMMRPAGQGRLLEVEATAFKKAFPNVVNFGDANGDIANRLQSEAADAAAKTNFVQQFVRSGKGSVMDGMAAYKASPAAGAPKLGADPNHPAAQAAGIAPPQQRVVGQVYNTPKGPMHWTANGWVP